MQLPTDPHNLFACSAYSPRNTSTYKLPILLAKGKHNAAPPSPRASFILGCHAINYPQLSHVNACVIRWRLIHPVPSARSCAAKPRAKGIIMYITHIYSLLLRCVYKHHRGLCRTLWNELCGFNNCVHLLINIVWLIRRYIFIDV